MIALRSFKRSSKSLNLFETVSGWVNPHSGRFVVIVTSYSVLSLLPKKKSQKNGRQKMKNFRALLNHNNKRWKEIILD